MEGGKVERMEAGREGAEIAGSDGFLSLPVEGRQAYRNGGAGRQEVL